jgi:hypothetical protein
MLFVTRPCPVCGGTTNLELAKEKFIQWRLGGAKVQDVWPEMDADTRELLISGTHPACWEKLFPPEPEGDDDAS